MFLGWVFWPRKKKRGTFLTCNQDTPTCNHLQKCASISGLLEPQTQISRISVCRCARKCSPKSNCPGGWKLARVPSRLWSGNGHLLSRLGRSNGWFHPSRSTKRNINDFFVCSISAKCQHLDGVKQSSKGYCKGCSVAFNLLFKTLDQSSQSPNLQSSHFTASLSKTCIEISCNRCSFSFAMKFGILSSFWGWNTSAFSSLSTNPRLGLPLHTDFWIRYCLAHDMPLPATKTTFSPWTSELRCLGKKVQWFSASLKKLIPVRVTKVDFERCRRKKIRWKNPWTFVLDFCLRRLCSCKNLDELRLYFWFPFSRIASQINLKVSCCRNMRNARSIVIATFESDKNVWKSVGTLNFRCGGTGDPKEKCKCKSFALGYWG